MNVTISGMTGKGSIRHNNREFTAKNVDPSRSAQNIVFLQTDLQQLYHELFDQALANYNAKKKKTRDKIPDYYEHIRTGKQEKLFHESIFQIGDKDTCGCGSDAGVRAAAALTAFAESFQARNPHLRVCNMVLHMDEATPHLHVDFVPIATDQRRGLSTRVSMKQALRQQGFSAQGKNMTEWTVWMEHEKQALKEIAMQHGFEIISLGGGRPHMDLPAYREAAQALDKAKQELSTVTEGLHTAQNALIASEVRLRELEAAVSPVAVVEAVKRVSKRSVIGTKVQIPAEEYETLLSTAQGAAAAKDHANKADLEAAAAREKMLAAQKDAADARAVAAQIQAECKAQLAAEKEAADYGRLWAYLLVRIPALKLVQALVAKFGFVGHGLAHMAYRLERKEFPTQ